MKRNDFGLGVVVVILLICLLIFGLPATGLSGSILKLIKIALIGFIAFVVLLTIFIIFCVHASNKQDEEEEIDKLLSKPLNTYKDAEIEELAKKYDDMPDPTNNQNKQKLN